MLTWCWHSGAQAPQLKYTRAAGRTSAGRCCVFGSACTLTERSRGDGGNRASISNEVVGQGGLRPARLPQSVPATYPTPHWVTTLLEYDTKLKLNVLNVQRKCDYQQSLDLWMALASRPSDNIPKEHVANKHTKRCLAHLAYTSGHHEGLRGI